MTMTVCLAGEPPQIGASLLVRLLSDHDLKDTATRSGEHRLIARPLRCAP
jgi:hypothetical protein